MIHEHVCCNRRFAALSRETSFVKRISFRSRAFHVSHLLPALHASRDTLHSLLRFTRNTVSGNFVTNPHESCWLGGGWVHEFPSERARCRDEQATGQVFLRFSAQAALGGLRGYFTAFVRGGCDEE